MAAMTKARIDTTEISVKIDDFAAVLAEVGLALPALGLPALLAEAEEVGVGAAELEPYPVLSLLMPRMPPWTWAGALEPLCFEAAILYALQIFELLVLREGQSDHSFWYFMVTGTLTEG